MRENHTVKITYTSWGRQRVYRVSFFSDVAHAMRIATERKSVCYAIVPRQKRLNAEIFLMTPEGEMPQGATGGILLTCDQVPPNGWGGACEYYLARVIKEN